MTATKHKTYKKPFKLVEIALNVFPFKACKTDPLGRPTQGNLRFWISRFSLTLSLPECLIEFCKVTLTLESVDEIL